MEYKIREAIDGEWEVYYTKRNGTDFAVISNAQSKGQGYFYASKLNDAFQRGIESVYETKYDREDVKIPVLKTVEVTVRHGGKLSPSPEREW